MEKRIFISHSSKDREVAYQICALLEDNGLECWIAPRNIPYGSAWAGEISKAIKNSYAFLFLSSNASNLSSQVSREIQLAVENDITIIPIHLDDSEYNDSIKYYLATIHCMIEYNATKIHKLATDIVNLLPPPPTAEEPAKTETNKEEKKPKKENHIRNMGISCLFSTLFAAASTYLFFLSDLKEIIRYPIAVVLLIIGFIPLCICRTKALKRYSVNKKIINLITVFSFVLAIGVGAGGYYTDHMLWYNDMDTKYHITITPPDDMSASDFKKAADTLIERLDILAGDTRYSAKISVDNIDIIVPRELFCGEDPQDILPCYLSRSMRFYVTSSVSYTGEYKEPYPQQLRITPDTIESIAIKNELPENLELPETMEEGYNYIELILDKEFVDNNAETFEFYGEKLIFAMDKEDFSNYAYFNTIRGEENNVFYLVNLCAIKNSAETSVYNITNEPSNGSLRFSIDIAPVFEKTKDNEKAGKYQCDSKELKGDTVTISILPGYSSITEGQWNDVTTLLKNRLDAIGLPYAFGYINDNPLSVVIRTSPDRMGLPVMNMLTSNRLYIKSSYTNLCVQDSTADLSVSVDENPVLVLKAKSDSTAEEYNFLAELAKKSNSKKLYLSTDSGMNILSTSPEIAEDGKTAVFNEVALNINQKLDAETKWIADLTEAIYQGSYPVTIKIGTFEFSDKKLTEDDFGVGPDIAEIESLVKTLSPEGTVSYTEKRLNITLDLTIDENLPQKMIECAEKLFKETDFENSTFETLAICAISEEGDERARIFFNKRNCTLYLNQDFYKDGYMETYGIFSGGRLQRDHDVFQKLVYSDEFMKQYIHEEDGYKDFN